MAHSITAARLLSENLATLEQLPREQGILDLACGSGRNGLFLARHKFSVTFADNNKAALAAIQLQLDREQLASRCWCVDLEENPDSVLDGESYAAILVFNYLHRPLLSGLKKAIQPGGIIVYETFTTAQRKFGRPGNPDFLLEPGELKQFFNDWQVLHNYEGELQDPLRAGAQIIARKPALTESTPPCAN